MRDIQLSSFTISSGQRPFVVAELSGNHMGSLDRAVALVEAAASAGADGFKLQTYTADSMTLDCDAADFIVRGTGAPWEARRLYDLYAEAATPYEWHAEIFERCYELGMIPFSTPFDEDAVDFLEALNCEIYKIASFEVTDTRLLQKIAKTGKPVIMSTGMAASDEIKKAVDVLREFGAQDIVLLQCTSAYPAQISDANLRTIQHLQTAYHCHAGLSDHTLGTVAPIVATTLGATVIEKHLTIATDDGAVDSHFSLTPDVFTQLVNAVKDAHDALGNVVQQTTDAESPCKAYRRSLYIAKAVKAGDIISDENVRAVRPGKGLSPMAFSQVTGKRFASDYKVGTALSWDCIANE